MYCLPLNGHCNKLLIIEFTLEQNSNLLNVSYFCAFVPFYVFVSISILKETLKQRLKDGGYSRAGLIDNTIVHLFLSVVLLLEFSYPSHLRIASQLSLFQASEAEHRHRH